MIVILQFNNGFKLTKTIKRMGKLIHVLYDDRPIILGMYSKNKGVVWAAPKGAEHIAHATWINPSARNVENRQNIDYFLVLCELGELHPKLINNEQLIISQKEFSLGERETERKHGVRYEIPYGQKHLEPLIRRVAIRDIWDFTLGKQPPKSIRRTICKIC